MYLFCHNLPWFSVWKGGQKYRHHASPKSCQTRVINHVKDEDQGPWFWRSSKIFSGFGVMDEVFDGFPAMSFHRFEGCRSQDFGFFIRHDGVNLSNSLWLHDTRPLFHEFPFFSSTSFKKGSSTVLTWQPRTAMNACHQQATEASS